MASTSQQTILSAFNQAAGGSATQPSTSAQGLIDALQEASQTVDSQTQATTANTDALGQGSQARDSGVGGTISGVIDTASQAAGGGLSLMPLVSLFSSLFGGGSDQQPAPLVPFSLPPALNLETTTDSQNVVWGENGLPKSTPGANAGAAQQITVQVQAMDSQSFLDHSDDIAQAVRQAMLNMHPLNDVIANL